MELALRVRLVSPDYQENSAQQGELVLREPQGALELQAFRLMALQALQAHLVAQVLRGPLGLPVRLGPLVKQGHQGYKVILAIQEQMDSLVKVDRQVLQVRQELKEHLDPLVIDVIFNFKKFAFLCVFKEVFLLRFCY